MSRIGFSAAATAAMFVSHSPVSSAEIVDLRTHSDAMGRTEISFCSRPSPDALGMPGHSFVAFYDEAISSSPKFRAIGHTVGPTASLSGTLMSYFSGDSVSGALAQERYTHMKQACLTVLLDRTDYARAMTAARPTLTAIGMTDENAATLERYSLSGNDCIDFTIRIARVLEPDGLVVPPRRTADLPSNYIRRLTEANP